MDTRTSTHQHVKPARQRRWLWALLVVALILAALAWAAYQHRAALFINAIDAALQPYGLHVETLAGLRLNTSSLQIRELTLLHGDTRAVQTLDEININFTATALISGRVDSIAIASAGINVPDTLSNNVASADPDLTTNAPATESQVPLADLLAAIPFARLHIARLQINGANMTFGASHLQNLSANLESMQLTCQPDQCHLSSGLRLSINKLHYSADARAIELDLVKFDTGAPINITLNANTNMLSLDTRSATLTLPAIRVDDTLTGLVGDIHRINLSQTLTPDGPDPAGLTAHTEVSVRELYTNVVDVYLWSMRLDQHLTWQRETLHMSGAVLLDGQRLLLNDLQHNAALGTGRGTFEIPRIEFNDNTGKLSDLWSPLPWDADILAGSANANAALNWRTDNNEISATGSIQVALNDVSGYINDIAFLRLSTDFDAELLPDWHLRSSRAASVSMASLDAGIELSNVRSDYRIDSESGSLSLSDASFNVFGGTVSSEQIDYHLQDNDSNFTIIINNIDLSQILGMGAYQGVNATGLVSGQLPVRLQGLTPSIRGGTLSAQQPGGTIRYSSGAAATGDATSVGNQSLDLVYQALEDYRFNLMETQVDYQESGELDLAIRMEGISPELNGGQRINLNLNINDDVPALLQSLQAARSVTDSIQSRLDARQE